MAPRRSGLVSWRLASASDVPERPRCGGRCSVPRPARALTDRGDLICGAEQPGGELHDQVVSGVVARSVTQAAALGRFAGPGRPQADRDRVAGVTDGRTARGARYRQLVNPAGNQPQRQASGLAATTPPAQMKVITHDRNPPAPSLAYPVGDPHPAVPERRTARRRRGHGPLGPRTAATSAGRPGADRARSRCFRRQGADRSLTCQPDRSSGHDAPRGFSPAGRGHFLWYRNCRCRTGGWPARPGTGRT